jgi:predicted O-methyltransferase YrrM
MRRAQGRVLRLGLLTLFGIRKQGFFIPYRYADQPAGPDHPRGYPALEPLFAAAEPAFLDMLARIDAHAAALSAIGGAAPPAPRWRQDWFPRLDAAAAYVLVRERRPRRIVEVGSGHSTRFMARAIADAKLPSALTAIDPAPRADIAGLGATVLRQPVQEVGAEPFSSLGPGDVLFIDSSHILMPGTDVDVLLNGVLPSLPPGVLVHIHDVFLPDPYPPEWEWRGYNEQLAVAALLHGGGYRLVWASRYVATRMADRVRTSVAGRLELVPGALESSLWLEKL